MRQRGRRGEQTPEARAKREALRRLAETKLRQAEAEKLAEWARAPGSLSARPAGPQFCAPCCQGRHGECAGLPCECLCYLGEEG